jgi:hypothetical protein
MTAIAVAGLLVTLDRAPVPARHPPGRDLT